MRRFGIQTRPQIKRNQRGERNHMWKGENATYAAFHYRVENKRGKPQHCEECGLTDPAARYEWANLTENYPDPADYRRLCKTCHVRMDAERRSILGRHTSIAGRRPKGGDAQ